MQVHQKKHCMLRYADMTPEGCENCCIHMLFGWETHVKDENTFR